MENKVHRDAGEKGGFNLIDDDGVIPAAMKDIGSKLAAGVARGQLGDISWISSPSYVHHYITHLGLVKNDLT